MAILKLKPSYKNYLWGGERLKTEYNKEYDGDVLAESWELSCHVDGKSLIEEGEFAGKTLQEYIEWEGKRVLGKNCMRFRNFPVLIKFIDAKQDLSIQVHPTDAYALKEEGQYGKTEMWYVVECEPDACLYYGFSKKISKEELKQRIQDETITEVLNKVPVRKGDVYFIEAGTVHAIGKGIVIAEIQQNSNVTYRVYDYGRVGADGKKRDLHIEKALEVADRDPKVRSESFDPHLGICSYFTVDKLVLDGHLLEKVTGNVDESSFLHILVLDGAGSIHNGMDLSFRKGDSILLTAGTGAYEIQGKCEALLTTIPVC
ncbi:MAG: class I mannose-6-phosphate isomerase [Lachnospiraceae bacterium]|nr:class I mannose-6-phosphate isomerase [Lachnospiraceae bacterium]